MNTSYERTSTGTQEWLTPPYILKELGEFDLDPCSPINRPYDTAKNHYNINDNGLILNWYGRVFCNPPYNDLNTWLEKCSKYKNCIALIFARTDTKAFHNYIFNSADALFFIEGRLSFYHADGKKGGTAGAPSVLISYNKENSIVLEKCNLKGKYIKL